MNGVTEPQAALATAIGISGTCRNSRSYLSIGESANILSATNAGTGRVTNGQDGASVQCAVTATSTGFAIAATLEADALEKNPVGVPYHQRFTLNSMYPGTVPGMTAPAAVGSFDTAQQMDGADDTCMLKVTSFGNDGSGGAMLATFDCAVFKEMTNPTNVCDLRGTIVLENCEK
jgi:hypothetical protein